MNTHILRLFPCLFLVLGLFLSYYSLIPFYKVISVYKYYRLEGDKVIRLIVYYVNMVKTTIDIEDELWKKFSIKVIEEHGGRKKNDVIEQLIKKYLKERKP